MSNRQPIIVRRTTKVRAASGRLRNEHFVLTADRIMLELEPRTSALVAASGEGGVEVQMLPPKPGPEYAIMGRSAVYEPEAQRLIVSGGIRLRENGVERPPLAEDYEIVVPTDGSFFESHEAVVEKEPEALRKAA